MPIPHAQPVSEGLEAALLHLGGSFMLKHNIQHLCARSIGMYWNKGSKPVLGEKSTSTCPGRWSKLIHCQSRNPSIWCLFLLVEGLQKPFLLHVSRLIAQVECLCVGYLHTNKGSFMSKVSWCHTLGVYSGSEYYNHFKSLSVITVNSKIEK